MVLEQEEKEIKAGEEERISPLPPGTTGGLPGAVELPSDLDGICPAP